MYFLPHYRAAGLQTATLSAAAVDPLDAIASLKDFVIVRPADTFTDTGGTTSAADTQAAASVKSRKGLQTLFVQSTSGSRPVLHDAGSGKWYLAFDGTDDTFIASAYDLGSPTGLTLAIAIALDDAGSYPNAICYGATFWEMRYTAGNRTPEFATPGVGATSATALTLGEPHVLVGRTFTDAAGTDLRVDGVQKATSAGTTPAIAYDLAIASRGNGTLFLQGKIYGWAVCNAAVSNGDAAIIETALTALF